VHAKMASSLFRQFDDDPFFSGYHSRMQGMDDMFAFSSPFLALSDGNDADRHSRHRGRNDVNSHHAQRGSELTPFGSAFDPFGLANSMMGNMNSMMGNVFQQMETMRGDPNSHCYMQSSVMSYRNDGSGQPKVYQATTSTRQAPGGIRETRKAVRDSDAGIEKMAIGRHLNERGHVVIRQRNARTGDIDENQDYINLDESEAPQFNDEWTQKTRQFASHRDNALGQQTHSTHRQQALDNRPHASHSRHDIDDAALPQSSGKHHRPADHGDRTRRAK